LFVRLKKLKIRGNNMLKEYAVALVLSTATPVTADKQDGAKQAPETTKEVATESYVPKPRTGNDGRGLGW
jgi:hypothetical protein